MAASPAQLEALARSRAIKAQKKLDLEALGEDTSGGKTPNVSPKAIKSDIPVPPMEDRTVWVQAMCAALVSLEVRHEGAVKNAVPIADEILAQYQARFL